MAKNDGEGYCFMDAQDLHKIREMLPLSKGVISLNSETTKEPPLIVTKVKRRLRQSQKPEMNELEKRCLAWLQQSMPETTFLAQKIRFRLGRGIWYKPDIFCFELMTAWEVKGPKSFRGGFENLKVAASLYPEIEWKLIWFDGRWQKQVVLP